MPARIRRGGPMLGTVDSATQYSRSSRFSIPSEAVNPRGNRCLRESCTLEYPPNSNVFLSSSNWTGGGSNSNSGLYNLTTSDYSGSRWKQFPGSADCNPPPSRCPPPHCGNPGGSDCDGDHDHDHDPHHHHHHHHHHPPPHCTPEPASMVLWGLGAVSFLGWRIRTRKENE